MTTIARINDEGLSAYDFVKLLKLNDKYDELIEFGSEAELKKQGKFYVQGKDYIVDEGDILNIRFNFIGQLESIT